MQLRAPTERGIPSLRGPDSGQVEWLPVGVKRNEWKTARFAFYNDVSNSCTRSDTATWSLLSQTSGGTKAVVQQVKTAPGEGFLRKEAVGITAGVVPPAAATGPVMRWALDHTFRGGPWQWCGWRFKVPRGYWVRMSCYIRFISTVPLPSHNFGIKIQGQIDNS